MPQPQPDQERHCLECGRVYEQDVARCPRDGSRLVRVGSGLPPGTVVDDRFTLDRLIGKGGMGSVYVARQHALGRDVAIKILHDRLGDDAGSVRRFFQEVRATSRLRSTHTVTAFDFGQTRSGNPYLVMELLEGISLGGLLELEGLLAPARAMDIARQICASLEDAHAAGIVHRDLKPDNVFLDRRQPGDHVKILDFGVAKILGAEAGATPLTRTGMVFGTPTYMSPEQASGRPVDGRADLYALGVLLFEMLTGSPPFQSENPMEVLYKHVHEPPPPLMDDIPGEPPHPHLVALVRALLGKRRTDRPSGVRQVRDQLERLLGGQPVARVSLEPAGPADPSPVGVSEPTVEARAAGDAHRSLGALTRELDLLGRERPRRRLQHLLETAGQGAGGAVLLVAAPWTGAEDLTTWSLQRARRVLGARTAEGACPMTPLHTMEPVRGWLERLLDVTTLERPALRERLRAHPALEGQTDEALVEDLVRFLRPERDDPYMDRPTAIAPSAARLLLRLARLRPVVLSALDLHRADGGTAAVVREVLQALEETRVPLCLILSGERPGHGAPATETPGAGLVEALANRRLPCAEPLPLSPVDDPAVAAMLEERGCLTPDLRDVLVALAGGRPGIARACWEHVADRADLRRSLLEGERDGAVPLESLPPAECAAVRDRVEDVLAGCPGPESARATLQRAAALGHHPSPTHLAEMIRREGRADLAVGLDDALDGLVAGGVLQEVGDTEEEPLRFADGLTREVALRLSGGTRQRRRLQRLAGETLAALPDDERRTLAGTAAAALAGGGRPEAAVGLEMEAALAVDAAEAEQRIAALRLARERLEQVPRARRATPALLEAERRLLLEEGHLLVQLGQHDAAAEAFETLRTNAVEVGDAEVLGQALRGLGEVDEARADYGTAGDLLARAAEAFREAARVNEAARCDLARAKVLERRGEYEGARAGYEGALGVFERHGDVAGLAAAHEALGMLATLTGDPEASLRQLELALEAQERLGDRAAAGKTLYNMAIAAYERGRLEEALEQANRALVVLDRIGHQKGVSMALGMLGVVLQRLDRVAEARTHMTRALRIREAMGDRRAVANARSNLADLATREGEYDTAIRLAETARTGYEAIGDRRGVALATANLGLAHLRLGDLHEAATLHGEAASSYEALGHRDGSLVTILTGLAEAREGLGDFGGARATLERARELALELDLAPEAEIAGRRLEALAQPN
ncbi:MAG: protein kinase domain-containing protein [Myxococcota bacterium]